MNIELNKKNLQIMCAIGKLVKEEFQQALRLSDPKFMASAIQFAERSSTNNLKLLIRTLIQDAMLEAEESKLEEKKVAYAKRELGKNCAPLKQRLEEFSPGADESKVYQQAHTSELKNQKSKRMYRGQAVHT